MGLFSWAVESPLEKAQKHFKKGQFDVAVEHYLKAIETGETPAVASFDLGLCYQRLSNFREAERAFSVAIKANPANAKAWELLSLTQCILGMLQEAEESARTALSCSIDFEQVFMSRMALVQSLVAQFETCGEHHYQPNDTMEASQTNLVRIYARMDIRDRLASEFKELIKAKPGFDEVWKFVALAGIYSFDPEWMPGGMRRLRELGSPHFEMLKEEFKRLHRISFTEAYLKPAT